MPPPQKSKEPLKFVPRHVNKAHDVYINGGIALQFGIDAQDHNSLNDGPCESPYDCASQPLSSQLSSQGQPTCPHLKKCQYGHVIHDYVQLPLPIGTQVQFIVGTQDFLILVSNQGKAFVIGTNPNGTGTGPDITAVNTWTQIMHQHTIISAAYGKATALLVTLEGHVYMFGAQFPVRKRSNKIVYTPELMDCTISDQFKHVIFRDSVCYLINANDRLFALGNNMMSACGKKIEQVYSQTDEKDVVMTPHQIALPPHETVQSAEVMQYMGLCITHSGNLYCWGAISHLFPQVSQIARYLPIMVPIKDYLSSPLIHSMCTHTENSVLFLSATDHILRCCYGPHHIDKQKQETNKYLASNLEVQRVVSSNKSALLLTKAGDLFVWESINDMGKPISLANKYPRIKGKVLDMFAVGAAKILLIEKIK